MGTVVNTASILLGGVCGILFGNLIQERHRETLTMACGISVLFLGIAGAMPYMLPLGTSSLPHGGTLPMIACLTCGGLLGEICDLEGRIAAFGEWLKAKTGNASDSKFVNGFVTASLTVCIGAMAVVGAIQDGLSGDWSILAAKSILDFLIVAVMSSAMGKGCMFSAIPVFLFEGAFTFLAVLLAPYVTESALDYISFIGSILIFCVGVNLVWERGIRVANLLPALALAVIVSFFPPFF